MKRMVYGHSQQRELHVQRHGEQKELNVFEKVSDSRAKRQGGKKISDNTGNTEWHHSRPCWLQ